MVDGLARDTIKKDSGQGGSKKGGYPICPSVRKTFFPKKVEEVVPTDRVKSLCDVELEEERGGVREVNSSDQIPDVKEVIMDAPCLHEGTLGLRNQGV